MEALYGNIIKMKVDQFSKYSGTPELRSPSGLVKMAVFVK